MEVYQDDGDWRARGIGDDLFTQGQRVDGLYNNIKEALSLHFENGQPSPEIHILIVAELKLNHAPAASG